MSNAKPERAKQMNEIVVTSTIDVWLINGVVLSI